MFDLSPEKLVILGLIALIVLGPERLPVMARKAGQVLAEVRRATGGIQGEMRDALAEPRRVLDDAVSEFGLPTLPTPGNLRRSLTANLTGSVDTTSRVPTVPGSASAPVAPSVDQFGLPPVPDDPTLN